MLAIDISELLRSQYAQFIKWISELDQGLTDRYGDRYNKVKQQFNRARDWYEKTKLEAKNSGVCSWLCGERFTGVYFWASDLVICQHLLK
jgi:hypothetical protein